MRIDHDSHAPDLGHYDLNSAIEARRIRKGTARPSSGSGLSAMFVLIVGLVIAAAVCWPAIEPMCKPFADAARAIQDGRAPG